MPRKPLDRARLIAAYLRGATQAVPGPSALMIETTVRCNLQCPMCPRTGGGYPNADMDDAILWPLLDEHARLGGDHVYLYGLGEPLMDPRIWDIIGRCHALDLGVVLSTNGTLLTEERRARLLDADPDHLLIGLDGASEATYSYYRAGGKYDRVVANVRALAAEKVRRKRRVALVVQFIRMAKNEHEIEAFTALWKDVPGIDEVRIKEEDIGLVAHRTYDLDGASRQSPCHFLWRGPMLVRYTGEVFPCYHFGGANESIGSLATSTLEDLWNGETMAELRGLHVARQAGQNPLCASCPALRPKALAVVGAMALRGATVRRLVPLAERVSRVAPGLLTERRTERHD